LFFSGVLFSGALLLHISGGIRLLKLHVIAGRADAVTDYLYVRRIGISHAKSAFAPGAYPFGRHFIISSVSKFPIN
jgi:hypothetical protein